MKLTEVEIQSFRCFERLIVSLEDDVTAVIGVNAAGKTALLDAIALSLLPLFNDIAQRKGNFATMDPPTFYRAFTGASLESADIRIVAASAANGGKERALRLQTTASYQEGDADIGLTLKWQQEAGVLDAIGHARSPRQSWLSPNGLDVASNGLYVPKTETADARHISIPAIAYYRDTRDAQFLRLSRETDRKTTDPDAARVMALDAAADFSEAQRWFYVRENQELRAAKQRGDIDLTDPVLTAVRDGVLQMLAGIERVYADDDPPRMKGVQRDAAGDIAILDFSQLSAGQRNLMGLTIDFARRLALSWPGWDNPLEAPGMMLIDEIELNLHPKWQQIVIPHLRKVFPNTQMIIATHSPLVLSTLHARQIRVLKDQQLYSPSVETYGTDSDRVQRQVMNTETIPPNNEFANDVADLYEHINSDNLDLADALLARLEEERGTAEPTLIKARTLVANRRWEAELGL